MDTVPLRISSFSGLRAPSSGSGYRPPFNAPFYKLAVGGTGGEQQNVNPVSGGTYSDLIFVKEIDSKSNSSAVPIGHNPNFGNTTQRYAPTSAQVGFRLQF